MISNHKLFVMNTFITLVGIPLLLLAYFAPFNFFVDITDVQYHDICVGDNSQLVTANRNVKFMDGYKASVRGELFKFQESIKLETVIHRDREFVYQVSKQPVTYEIVWSEPIMTPGLYGASDLIELDTILFKKTAYFSEDDQIFEVKYCDI